MKRHDQFAPFVFALCCLFFALATAQEEEKRAPVPTLSSASGIWIGYADHKCFRLELDADGTGYFAMAALVDEAGRFIPHTGMISRVTKWRPNAYRIELELRPVTDGEEAILLTNSFLGGFSIDMDLEVSHSTFKHKVTLYNETDLRARTEKMKEGIETFRKKEKRK